MQKPVFCFVYSPEAGLGDYNLSPKNFILTYYVADRSKCR